MQLKDKVPLLTKENQIYGTSQETVSVEEQTGKRLHRSLSFFNAFTITIASLFGSGVFFSPALVARRTPNAFISIIVWLLAGLLSYLGSLCYCELVCVVKKTGSTYIFIHETYGRYVSLPTLLTMVFVLSPFGFTVVLLNASTYVCSAFIEDKSSNEFYWWTRVLAMLMLYVIAFISCLGAKISALLQTVINIIQVLTIASIVGAGVYYLAKTGDTSNFQQDVIFNNTLYSLQNEMSSISASLFSALFCFDGWYIIASLSEEIKNPKRNIILIAGLSIPFVTFLYTLVVLSCLSMLTHEELGATDVVFVDAFKRVGIPGAEYFVPIIVLVSSIFLSGIFHVSRFILSGAREGQLPKFLSLIHSKRETPIPAICLIVLLTTLATLSGFDIEIILQAFNFAIWLEYGIAFTIVLYLRYKKPDVERMYKVWLTTPIFMVFVSIFLLGILIYKIPWSLVIFVLIVASSVAVNKFLMDIDPPRYITNQLDLFCFWLMRKTPLVLNKFDDSSWEK